jgi:hypothetical protein
MDGLGIKPSEYLRKAMPEIPWDDPIPTPERKHWTKILGDNQQFFTDFLMKWYSSKPYPYHWNEWYESQTPSSRELWHDLLGELVENRWYAPKVIEGRLSFGSGYPIERKRTYRDIMDEADGFPSEGSLYE